MSDMGAWGEGSQGILVNNNRFRRPPMLPFGTVWVISNSRRLAILSAILQLQLVGVTMTHIYLKRHGGEP